MSAAGMSMDCRPHASQTIAVMGKMTDKIGDLLTTAKASRLRPDDIVFTIDDDDASAWLLACCL
jgi:hypothetical protein